MRRLQALFMVGLMAAPLSAVAGPDAEPAPSQTSPGDARSHDPWTQTFEWSMSAGRARLGVMVMSLTPELREHFGAPRDRGVLVARVQPGSAAAAAGLAVGDVLTEVKGAAIDSAADVLSTLAPSRKDETVQLAVIRDGKPLALSVKMLDEPAPAPGPTGERGQLHRQMPRQMMSPGWPDWVRDWFKSLPDFPGLPDNWPWAPQQHDSTVKTGARA